MSEQAFADALADGVKWHGLSFDDSLAKAVPALGRDPTIRDIQAAKRARPDVFPPNIEYRRLTR